MILDKKTRGNNRNLFYEVAIILLGILAGYFWYNQFEKDNREPVTVTDIQADDSLSRFEDFKTFDFQIFTKPEFRNLKTIGEAPVSPGATGRTDIFAPF